MRIWTLSDLLPLNSKKAKIPLKNNSIPCSCGTSSAYCCHLLIAVSGSSMEIRGVNFRKNLILWPFLLNMSPKSQLTCSKSKSYLCIVLGWYLNVHSAHCVEMLDYSSTQYSTEMFKQFKDKWECNVLFYNHGLAL